MVINVIKNYHKGTVRTTSASLRGSFGHGTRIYKGLIIATVRLR